VLANLLAVPGFEFESSEEVLKEIKAHLLTQAADAPLAPGHLNFSELKMQTGLTRIGEIPIYQTDSIVRHATSLQAAQAIVEPDMALARMSATTAEKLGKSQGQLINIKQAEVALSLPVQIDARIADNCIYLPGGTTLSANLAHLYGDIEQVN